MPKKSKYDIWYGNVTDTRDIPRPHSRPAPRHPKEGITSDSAAEEGRWIAEQEDFHKKHVSTGGKLQPLTDKRTESQFSGGVERGVPTGRVEEAARKQKAIERADKKGE